LHVHSPASHVQKYGTDEAAWERFIADLEALPSDLAVLGINDYLFLDGYKRVLAAKAEGRLQNVVTVFPSVELRLARLAGADRLTRVNYHVIFSESLDVRTIESQFLTQLHGKAQLTPEVTSRGIQWKGFVTKESLEALGAAIRSSSPEKERAKFNESDFELGVNNINFEPEQLHSILDSGSGIPGNYITAVGRSEWEEMRWNDQSIAEKKNIINSVAAVFTAAEDATAFERARMALDEQGVNSKLLDCSDAHDFSDSEDKDRVGNCLLWVKADPTFLGLQAALQDYEGRIHVGVEPPVFQRMRTRPRCFMHTVAFDRTQRSGSKEKWFEGQKLELNPELVAIIGNRGSGKSALMDCLAFAAHCDYPVDKTSFLHKFRASKDGKASDFTVRVSWRGGDPSAACLGDEQERDAVPMATHLPQHFIDQLCNELGDEFALELERAIFSHVREDERLGAGSLRELIGKRAHMIDVAVERLRKRLHDLNVEIADLERQSHPGHVDELQKRLNALRQEARGLWENRTPYPSRPSTPGDEEKKTLDSLKLELETASDELAKKQARRTEVRSLMESAKRLESQATLARQRIEEIEAVCKEDLEALGIEFADLVSVTIDLSALTKTKEDLAAEKSALDGLLDEDDSDSLPAHVGKLANAVADVTKGMTEPQQQHEAALKAHQELRHKLRGIIGDSSDSDSVRGLQARLSFIKETLQRELEAQYQARLGISRELFTEQEKLVGIYEELYGPVQAFVDKHESQGDLAVSFEAQLVEQGFEEDALRRIAHNRKGTYYGTNEGRDRLSRAVGEVEFDSWPSLESFLTALLETFNTDMREGFEGVRRHIHDQLKCEDPADFYDHVFGLGYLIPRYRITLNGKPLSDLSPGEKGALLLVFYLLVDKSDAPLLIDQPEENLDNQTVFTVLRPFIREARSRRQVILVTHNPNIAVAAGADQVIYCAIDKAGDYAVSYEAGALENPRIGKRIVDVLEGTMPAFEKRREKYALTK
jgi:ABC-type lipoprotein export system ATPase subunit